MELFNDCPECGKPLSRSRQYCACGWKISLPRERAEIMDRLCRYITPEGRCTNIGTIAPQGLNGRWYCCKHWYKAVSEQKR